MKWAIGLTTVPQRRTTHLPQTLRSISAAGFDDPILFVDGCKNEEAVGWENEFRMPIVPRFPAIRGYGNWMMGLIEIYIRKPDADRFIMFQDDLICVKNMRQYLEQQPYVSKSYQNLYLFPQNEVLCKKAGGDRPGWYESNQRGRGAVALCFDKAAVLTLLGNQQVALYMAERPQSVDRGHKAIDGGIVSGLALAGWKEYVHYPALIQHTGTISTMGNRQHLLATSFPGESHDALEFLGK